MRSGPMRFVPVEKEKSRSETADYRLCKIESTWVADDSESDGFVGEND